MCLILGFYRIIQLVCLIPVIVDAVLDDLNRQTFTVILNETERYPSWCFPPGQYYNMTNFEEGMQTFDGVTYDFAPGNHKPLSSNNHNYKFHHELHF